MRLPCNQTLLQSNTAIGASRKILFAAQPVRTGRLEAHRPDCCGTNHKSASKRIQKVFEDERVLFRPTPGLRPESDGSLDLCLGQGRRTAKKGRAFWRSLDPRAGRARGARGVSR